MELQTLAFLKGGAQMGELIRSKDWSQTPLGAPETWPDSLRTTVSILLNSRFPMFVWWGPSLTTIYNDAYCPIAGAKHPELLGRSGREAWAEIWDDLEPLVKSVFSGTSTWSEDQVLYMNRRGYIEETYFTFSYSPVFDEKGKVGGLFCACIETTEKVLAARRIAESERNLRNTILQSPVAMCILRGPEFVVEIANSRMYELWGRGVEEIAGRPIFEGLPEARHQGLEELLQSVYHTGETFTASERPVQLPRDGRLEDIYLNFVYEPFREVDGAITGILAIAIDVTSQVQARQRIEEIVELRTRELGKANEALLRSNQELQRSNANLEEFAYAASHDLKEPIRKIHFFSERLEHVMAERMTPEEHRYFERLQNASRRMGSLIDDLLSYSQISMQQRRFETVDMNVVLGMVLEDLDLEIEEKGATVQVDKLFTLQGHQRQLQQAFHNLIGNALKYSKPGVPPQINVRCKKVLGREANLPPEEADRLFYCLTVKDNGIGFAQEDAERIFNVFTRLHGLTEYRGTGIGLSIVRKVIENHHGFVSAQSRPGEGATFMVLLPVET